MSVIPSPVASGARSAAPSPGRGAVRHHDLYDVIGRRRDVRGEFTGAPIDPAVLRRVLDAAHAAPSVGLSQPWDFVVVSSVARREVFRAHVLEERERFAATLPPDRRDTFAGIRIEGIVDASVGIVVTYDADRAAPSVLGRHTLPETGLYSVCLAIENLWLAATAEGLGVGWVSFYREAVLAELVAVPDGIRPIAWLCVGPVSELAAVPDLERHGWRRRLPLDAILHHDTW